MCNTFAVYFQIFATFGYKKVKNSDYIEDRLPVAYAAKDLPPYNTVFYYFSKWKHEGVFEELMDTLHRMVRKLMGGRNPRSRHH